MIVLQWPYMMFENIEVKKDILTDEKYKYLFTVEEMNKLVLEGIPLRDAYKKIGADVQEENLHMMTANQSYSCRFNR